MHQIRYFLALSQTLNFTRAAEACNVTQPSLTRAIRLLEHELGGELLRRERGLTHLTDLGRQMLPLLTQCHESAQNARAVADAMRHRRRASLRIAASLGVGLGPFAPHLAELLGAFEGLGLAVHRGDAEETARALREGEADLAIAEPAAMGWERFESWPLFADPMALLVHPGHRLAGQSSAPLAALAGERLALRRHCSAGPTIEALLAASGIDLNTAVRVGADEDAVALVATGAAVALAPASVAAPMLCRVGLEGVALARELRLHAVQGRPREPSATMLLTQLRAANFGAYGGPAASIAA
jgi:DNA-binding transcriptional LysR family regulator